MKLKKAICLLAVVGCLVGSSAGCGQPGKSADYLISEYHASCLSRDEYDMKLDFRKANITKDHYWRDSEYGEYNGEFDGVDLPDTRQYVMNSQTEIDNVFTRFPAVDFEKQSVLIYFYTEFYPPYNSQMYAITEEGTDKLKIYFLIDVSAEKNRMYNYRPTTCSVITIIDKVDRNIIEFVRVRKYEKRISCKEWQIN